jgi:hypothetical protein
MRKIIFVTLLVLIPVFVALGVNVEASNFIDNERFVERIQRLNSYVDKDLPIHDHERQELMNEKLRLMESSTSVSLEKIVDDLNETGGFTYDIRGREIKQAGFAVSIFGFEKQFDIAKMTDRDKRLVILDYYLTHKDVLNQPDNNLGAWVNPENGMLYLDVTKVFFDIKKARQFAIEEKQEAFFDFQTMDSVML